MKKCLLKVMALCFLTIPTISFSETASQKTVDELNSILRGELSAIETYNQAITKVMDNEPNVEILKKYRNDHITSADKIKSEVLKLNGTPSQDSGAWGTLTGAIQGTAKLFGDRAALAAIKSGEELGLKDYRETLLDPEVSQTVKNIIKENNLISIQEAHIQGIENFINKIS